MPTPKCERCGATDVKLYPHCEWLFCWTCLMIERENERINERDKVLEDRRLYRD